MARSSKRPGDIPKAHGYRIGLFTSLSDLRAMIDGLGVEFVLWLVYTIDRDPDLLSLIEARKRYAERNHVADESEEDDEPEFDSENIYNLPSIRQSIKEDRKR